MQPWLVEKIWCTVLYTTSRARFRKSGLLRVEGVPMIEMSSIVIFKDTRNIR